MSYGYYPEYVSVAEQRAKAEKIVANLRRQRKDIQPVAAFKGAVARSFWGKSWCGHLESYADYANRIERGRRYIRAGCVCHLEIEAGAITALVSGASLYSVTISIKPLPKARWGAVCRACSGRVGSLLELLRGVISNEIMGIVSDREQGIFPSPNEIMFSCSCPDGASMCKHVAAVLYGIGRRFETAPELFFVLRGVDAADLIAADAAPPWESRAAQPEPEALGALFGIDIDMGSAVVPRDAEACAKTVFGSRPSSGSPGEGQCDAPFDRSRLTGAAVRKLRRLAALTQAQFAAALGVAPASIARWEATKGTLNLHAASIARLAAFKKKQLRKQRRTAT